MSLHILERYLKNIDRDFEELLFYTKYTSIYLLEDETWRSLDIYGTLVLYKSMGQNIISIFNKSNLKDFSTKVSKVSLQDEILLINNKFGVWFHDKDAMKETYKMAKNF